MEFEQAWEKLDKDLNEENKMYQFCYDNYEMAEKFVEIFLDIYVNPNTPCMEIFNGVGIIIDKYNLGRKIILENCSVKNDVEEIFYSKLEDKIWNWTDNLGQEILEQAIEYADNNEVIIHT